MPKTRVNGIELYYEEHGSGEPLLLIEGLGYATWMWYRQVPELSRRYRVITFDNRGVGDSDKPDIPYSIEMMADDAAGLLRALGISRSHILGTSMGGYIAQALAVGHPGLVHTLILACTSFGGPNAVPIPQETLAAMLRVEGLSPEEVLARAMSTAFSRQFMDEQREEVRRIVAWRLAKPTPRYSWLHQFNAVAAANLEDQVRGIADPTLIITGDADRVVPAGNSALLAEAIPGARLRVIPGGEHLLFIEQDQEFNRIVLEFLSEYPMMA